MSEANQPQPEILEPSGLPLPPPDAATRGVMREMEVGDIAADLETKVQELRPRVAQATENALAGRVEKLSEEIEVKQLRTGGHVLREAWQDHTTEGNRIRDDHQLSPEGKEERTEELRTRRDERIGSERERLTGLADLLVDRHPPTGPLAVTQEVANRGHLLGGLLGHTLPEDVLSEVLAEVHTATDERASEARRVEARATLQFVFRPILRRRATLPEKFAEPFQGAYADTLELVDELLDSDHTHRAAKEMRGRFLTAFKSVDNIARQNRGWDDTLCHLAGGFFTWDD